MEILARFMNKLHGNSLVLEDITPDLHAKGKSNKTLMLSSSTFNKVMVLNAFKCEFRTYLT
jgi:hypothetical protein